MSEKIVRLPSGYDPNDDGGKLAVEQFLQEDNPPTEIRVEPLSITQWIAVATYADTDSTTSAERSPKSCSSLPPIGDPE